MNAIAARTRRLRSLAGFGAVLGCLACGASAAAEDPERPPNVVLIVTDDQRWDTLGCTGGEYVETPALDALAAEGILFDRSYVVASLCSPSRASILTGQYPHRHGVLGNEPLGDALAGSTILPELLQEAGYETAFLGKWHLGADQLGAYRGFDRWVSFNGQGRYRDPELDLDGERRVVEGYLTDLLTDFAVEWIEREREEPFLLILSHKSCHTPYIAPPRHANMLTHVEIELPPSRLDPPGSLPEHYREPDPERKPFRGEYRDVFVDWSLRAYHEMIPSIDDSVARVVDALERTEQLGRTAILFTSDNGLLLGEHRFMQKRKVLEPSIRVPLIAVLPGVLPASEREPRLVLNVDLAPTVLDLAGLERPDWIQGRSLLDLWRADAAPWRTRSFHFKPIGPDRERPRELALRSGRWKYLLLLRVGVEEALFDLEADPGERDDLAGDAESAETLVELRRAMLAEMEALDVPDAWRVELQALVDGHALEEVR